MSRCSVPSVAAFLVLLLQVVGSLRLTIQPPNLHVQASVVSNISVLCTADEPISGCQFKIYENRYKREMPILDLGNETVSEAEQATMIPKLFGRISGYNYTGRGLKKGECGISIMGTASGGEKQWIIGCRVRGAKGGAWSYQEMSVYGSDVKAFNIIRPENKFIVLPGESLSILFKGEELLTYCHFQLPITGLDVNFDKGLDSAATSIYHYHGESLAAGDCGIMMHRIDDKRNGWLNIVYRTKTNTLEWVSTALVLAKVPESLELKITAANMTENSTVVATCTVKNSRPFPKISWFIGDILVRQDDVDDIPEEEWKWPYEARSMSQILEFKLSKHHNRKEIKCMVEHVALNYALLAKETIKFYYPDTSTHGYELFPRIGSYKLHTEGKTWKEAKEKCNDEDAHLAIINSEAEAAILKQIFDRFSCLGGPTATALLGFYKNQEGEFVTIFGQPLSSTGFTRWSGLDNQPDNTPPGENCGSIHRNGGLNDFDCQKTAPFFCEKHRIPPEDDDSVENTDNIPKTPSTYNRSDINMRDLMGIDFIFPGEMTSIENRHNITQVKNKENQINKNETKIFSKYDDIEIFHNTKDVLDNNIENSETNGGTTDQAKLVAENVTDLYVVIANNQDSTTVIDERSAEK